jgi:hypothetical protein
MGGTRTAQQQGRNNIYVRELHGQIIYDEQYDESTNGGGNKIPVCVVYQ